MPVAGLGGGTGPGLKVAVGHLEVCAHVLKKHSDALAQQLLHINIDRGHHQIGSVEAGTHLDGHCAQHGTQPRRHRAIVAGRDLYRPVDVEHGHATGCDGCQAVDLDISHRNSLVATLEDEILENKIVGVVGILVDSDCSRLRRGRAVDRDGERASVVGCQSREAAHGNSEKR